MPLQRILRQPRRPGWCRRLISLTTALAIPLGLGIVGTATPAQAATGTPHYVDCSKAKAGTGTQASPWNSLAPVNATTFVPGDQILLARGTTCNGTLAPKGSGSAAASIAVDAYGTGAKPVVAGGGASDAVVLTNQQYWEIRNLEITNHGATAANRRGVHIVLQDYGTGTHYRLTNLTVHDVNGDGKKDLGGSAGIQFDVYGSAVKTKFDDVILDGNTVYTVDRSGINMSTSWMCRASMGWISGCTPGVYTYYPWTNFVVRNNTVHDIGGDGIVMQYTQNGLAEHNVAYQTSARSYGSNAAIWDWNADNVTFQYNEAYQVQKLSDNNDGMAWDADFGTNGTVYQYNYSHDNPGGMAMFCGCGGGTSSTANAVFRYNVSQNDGSQVLRGYGASNGWFYNNTVYEPAGSTANILDLNSGTYATVANNLIVNNGSGGYHYTPALTTFRTNLFNGNQSGAPSGQLSADPQLVAPNTGGTGIGTVAGYQIKAGSPAIGAGTVLPGNGGLDYWGHTVPAACAPDIGADQLSTPNDASCAAVANGGFESGAIAPWTAVNSASVVTGNAHSGLYAVQVGASPASAQQVVTVAPDTTYRLTGWAKAATAGEKVAVGVKNYGGTDVSATASGTGYASESVTFHTGPSSTQATVYCAKTSGSGAGFCDDLTATVAVAPSSVIVGVGSGRCADVSGANQADGTTTDLWDCSGSVPNQTFASFSDGTLRTMGKCLTAASNSSAAAVTIATCGSAAGQQWTVNPVTQSLSPYSGMCLDANGGGTGDGTQLIIYACSGSINQQWTLPLPDQPWAPVPATNGTVDPASEYALPFDGIGAISGGGGNSRLLYDYPAQQRSDILDYLFKPGYGANLQILKIEIGGDTNSTDGAEHSFEHTKGVINCGAGYEMWLAAQAKARNPAIKLVGLTWGAPAWVGEGGTSFYTNSAITYLTDWLTCAKSQGLTIDYLGGWNERYAGYAGNYSASAMPWYQNLKTALATVSPTTKVVAADDTWAVATDMRNNPAFANAVDVVGVHYPCGYLSSQTSCPANADGLATGKPLWASENGSQDLDTGALPMARANNRVFLDAKMTASVNWPAVAGIQPGLHFATDGLIHADQPWSGAYHVGASTWVTAQTTQFTQPGWLIDDNTTGTGSGYLAGTRGNGSYVTYLAPDKSAWSTVVETVDATSAQTLNLTAAVGLPGGAVHVWTTDLSDPRTVSPMTYVGDVSPVGGVYSIPLKAGHMYTVTTVTPAHAPSTAVGPARTQQALPYTDTLGTAPLGAEPALFSDMNGAFESAACAGGRSGNCLTQAAPAVPVCWACSSYSNPYTLIGDRSWSNYTVASDVLLPRSGQVEVIGRAQAQNTNNSGLEAYHLFVSDTGAWSIQRSDLSWGFTTLASGTGPKLGTNAWHRLSLSMQGSTITASVDGITLGTVTDATYGSGPAGLGTGSPTDSLHGYYGAQFSKFSVTAGTAPTVAAGTYQLVNRKSGQLLDVANGYTADGTLLDQWPSTNGTNQQWQIASAGSGYYSVTGVGSGKSLDVPLASPTAGTQADVLTVNHGNAQQWSLVPDGGGYFTVENRASGYVLDISNQSTSQGASVIQWPFNDGTNQQWQLVKIG